MAKLCIVTGEPITPENDSKAHVFPSALGGRLKPVGIINKDANTLLGDKIDLPLIQAFQSLMNLLNGSRDRGQNQPTRMTDDSGKHYIFTFGEPLSLAKPDYQETVVGGDTHITIKARNLKETRTLLGRVKAKSPTFDIDEALRHAVVEHSWPDGVLHHSLQIGASVTFPALFVAASIFSSHHGQNSHPQLKAYVKSFDPGKPTMPPDTFYFLPPRSWINPAVDVSHVIVFIGDAANRRALVYIELFNLACVGVVIPFEGPVDINHTYGIDVLTGREIPIPVDESIIRSVPWVATHHLGDAFLYNFTEKKMGDLVQLARQLEWDANIQKIVQRAWGPVSGRRLMPKDCANLIGEVVNFIAIWWKNPVFSSEICQAQLPQFDSFCTQIEHMLPFFARCRFRSLIVPHRAALVKAATRG